VRDKLLSGWSPQAVSQFLAETAHILKSAFKKEKKRFINEEEKLVAPGCLAIPRDNVTQSQKIKKK
jgi:hypothetical protein